MSQHVTLAFLARVRSGISCHAGPNSWKDLTKGFIGLFLSELGNPNRLSSGALAFMYYDMNGGTTGKDAMSTIKETRLF